MGFGNLAIWIFVDQLQSVNKSNSNNGKLGNISDDVSESGIYNMFFYHHFIDTTSRTYLDKNQRAFLADPKLPTLTF